MKNLRKVFTFSLLCIFGGNALAMNLATKNRISMLMNHIKNNDFSTQQQIIEHNKLSSEENGVCLYDLEIDNTVGNTVKRTLERLFYKLKRYNSSHIYYQHVVQTMLNIADIPTILEYVNETNISSENIYSYLILPLLQKNPKIQGLRINVNH